MGGGRVNSVCFFYVLEGEILNCYGIYSRYVLQSADKIRDKVRRPRGEDEGERYLC